MSNSSSIHISSLIWLACYLGHPTVAQPGAVDTNFTAAVSGSFVHSMAVTGDGKVLLGGSFSSVNRTPRNGIARLNAAGTLDLSFDPGTGAIAEVLAVAAQTDGKVLLGGSFMSVNHVARNRIARLNSDGSVDAEFNPGSGADLSVRAIRIQTDGKILIGGQFTHYSGTARSCIARLNTDGTLDPTFNPGRGVGGTFFVNAVAVLGDGRIMVGGDFSSFDGHPCGSIVRLQNDGSLDQSFDSGRGTTPDNPIISVAVQLDGRIVIGGSFYTYQGVPRVNIARLNQDGTLDRTFDPGKGISGGLYNMIQSVATCAQEKILVGGSFDRVNGAARANLILLNADGSMNTNFATKVDSPVRALVIQEDSSVLLGGEFNRVDGTAHGRVARLNPAGSEVQVRVLNAVLGPNGFRCQAQSAIGAAVLEGSVDLINWLPLRTNAILNVAAEFQDSDAGSLTRRFYRIRQL